MSSLKASMDSICFLFTEIKGPDEEDFAQLSK